jgi:hypothetical protein
MPAFTTCIICLVEDWNFIDKYDAEITATLATNMLITGRKIVPEQSVMSPVRFAAATATGQVRSVSVVPSSLSRRLTQIL